MTKIEVVYSVSRYVTRAGDPEDRWDHDDTAADIELKGIKLAKGYSDLTVSFPVEYGKVYFLLWADYDTGDSFGRDDNQVEWIDLFTDPDKAQRAREALTSEPKDNKWESRYSRSYARDDDTVIQTHIPWVGYFEHLNALNITPVMLTGTF